MTHILAVQEFVRIDRTACSSSFFFDFLLSLQPYSGGLQVEPAPDSGGLQAEPAPGSHFRQRYTRKLPGPKAIAPEPTGIHRFPSSRPGAPAGPGPAKFPARALATACGPCAIATLNFRSSISSARQSRCAQNPGHRGAQRPAYIPVATAQSLCPGALDRSNR